MNDSKKKRYRRTKNDLEADIEKSAESIIKRKGFSAMLVTDLLKKAKIEPPVFYNRYNNLGQFLDDFVKKYDYWFKDVLSGSKFPSNDVNGYVSILIEMQKALSKQSVMLELLRWEIAEGNETTVRTAMLRELHTMPLVRIYEEKFRGTGIDIAALSSLIIGGIYYLNLHRDRSPFSEIDLNTQDGRQRIESAIKAIGNMIYQSKVKEDLRLEIAEKCKLAGVSQDIINRCILK